MFKDLIALRVGYKIGYDLDNLTFSLGIKLRNLFFDYTLSLMSRLNSTHHIGLTYKLGKK